MSGGAPLQVAVVDTDSGFLQVLAKRMDAQRWRHRTSAGPVPPDALIAMRADALVIDLAILGPQAWDYLAMVCERLPALGVVVCTGRSSVAQRVRGLRMGADDWVTKPCHPEEVVARVESVVRRRRAADAAAEVTSVEAGELVIRPDQYQAFVGPRSVELTRREFELIHLLASVRGQVLQREDIYQRVWGYAMAHGDRSVDVFVRKLRLKLEKASPAWRYIHTHFGVGYRFQAEPVDGSDPSAEHDREQTTRPAPVADLSVAA
jgi:DNA-binding response OmpR family regulator